MPNFGNETDGASVTYIAQNAATNYMKGSAYLCPDHALAQSLSGYFSGSQVQFYDHPIKGALYRLSDFSLVDVTEEKICNMRNFHVLQTFNFTVPPYLAPGEYYIITFWGSWSGFDYTYLSCTGSTPPGGYYESKVYTGTYEDPWAGYSETTTNYHSYCTYDITSAPSVPHHRPTIPFKELTQLEKCIRTVMTTHRLTREQARLECAKYFHLDFSGDVEREEAAEKNKIIKDALKTLEEYRKGINI